MQNNDPMMELYIFETSQMIEQLEQILILAEESGSYDVESINEIFRIMHTIKGSSAMMLYNTIATLAHSLEDLFFYLREGKPHITDYANITDLVFSGLDFIKVELVKIKNGDEVNGDASELIERLKIFLQQLKGEDEVASNPYQAAESNDAGNITNVALQNYYISKVKDKEPVLQNAFQATVFFEEECGLENLRAFALLNELEESIEEFHHEPEDIDKSDSIDFIREYGFRVFLKTNKTFIEVERLLQKTIFLKKLELLQLELIEYYSKPSLQDRGIVLDDSPLTVPQLSSREENELIEKETASELAHQSIINVSVAKLDKLMDLVGEMVIAEAMVTQNPDLQDLELRNFQKAARQLNKITTELQDIVMSVRMVPLAGTFQKMHRTIRDMCKKLDKEVKLRFIGEETEVDKNIIEHISDPLMHLIRNSIDHGIEQPEVREDRGKLRFGTVTLEAKNSGSDVLIIVRDDGDGLNKERILAKAKKSGLLTKASSELTDKEIYNLIFLPGFSTNEDVTEFSGRGVGMDVVCKNIASVGGSVVADSEAGMGTTITLKIPLTLAIIDGMNLKVGNSRYTIPITSIRESFRPKVTDLLRDPDSREMLMVRGQCYSVLRLHRFYKVQTDIQELTDGIIVMTEHDGQVLCLFADELLGQQQVVVKTLPTYVRKLKEIPSLAGCTLLGDGCISLILDVGGLLAGLAGDAGDI